LRAASHDAAELLRRCDTYLDAAPREHSEVVDVGPLRSFVSRAPWPYYVRPRPELDLTAHGAVSVDDVVTAADVLAAHGQAVSFEWVVELVPSLSDALLDAGYDVSAHPLLSLDLTGRLRSDATAQLVASDSPDVAVALAVSDIGFSEPGTGVSTAGVVEREAVTRDDAMVAFVRARVRDGRSVLAVLHAGPAGVICSGWHQPVGDTTEIVGVATLPAFRRRGHAADVVAVLLDDAAARGCTLALLSAADDDVARVYERVGFARIGHTGAAEPRNPDDAGASPT
jgi:GNAT superfamily N-acetyltransferase